MYTVLSKIVSTQFTQNHPPIGIAIHDVPYCNDMVDLGYPHKVISKLTLQHMH